MAHHHDSIPSAHVRLNFSNFLLLLLVLSLSTIRISVALRVNNFSSPIASQNELVRTNGGLQIPSALPTALRATHSTRSESYQSTKSPTAQSEQTMSKIPIRVLCLHGKGGDGKSFVNSQLRPLRNLLEKRLETWGSENECSGDENLKLTFHWEEVTAPFDIESGGFSWWTMPPGVRSYDAKEYEGFHKSSSMVMNKIFPNENECNFDIVFGHSQGAILTASLLSLHEKMWTVSSSISSSSISTQQPFPSVPMGYILNGVAWPNPYNDLLLSLAKKTSESNSNYLATTCNENMNKSSPQMLFLMGKSDSINPIESATKVYDAYKNAGMQTSVVYHEGGHSVPMGRDWDSEHALEEVADWIMGIAEAKLCLFATSCTKRV